MSTPSQARPRILPQDWNTFYLTWLHHSGMWHASCLWRESVEATNSLQPRLLSTSVHTCGRRDRHFHTFQISALKWPNPRQQALIFFSSPWYTQSCCLLLDNKVLLKMACFLYLLRFQEECGEALEIKHFIYTLSCSPPPVIQNYHPI